MGREEPSAHFSPAMFQFLQELGRNNNRDWFMENKERYERVVREPCLRFITDVGARLTTISRHIEADPRPNGGSLSRIYRDIRFSKDKSPYKTHVAMHFWHRRASEEKPSPGFYLHLDSGRSMSASGLWQPDAATLKKVRGTIVKNPRSWGAVLKANPQFEGESLQRPPPGFPRDHPFIEDLKRKDFVATLPFTDAQVTSPSFLDAYLSTCRSMAPLDAFLAKAVGLPW